MQVGTAITVLCVLGFASAVGTPHILVETTCSTFDGRTCLKVIAACTYYGVQGRRTIIPHWEPDQEQNCPGISFLRLRWPILQWNGPASG